MDKERRRVLAAIVVAGAYLTAAGIPVLNWGNTERSIHSLMGSGHVQCGNKEGLNGYMYGAIVVPGAGTLETPDGSYVPNFDQYVRLEAATIAYSRRLAPLIIVLDGVAKPGEDRSIEKAFLAERVSHYSNNRMELSDEDAYFESKSFNTATNMKALHAIEKVRGLKNVLIVTNAYHEDRATLLACANQVAARSVSAESLVASENPERIDEMLREYHSKVLQHAVWKEKSEILLGMWDPTGKVSTFFERILR